MLELLTGALARRNPLAYAAHFRRLGPAAQLAYLDQLAGEDLPDHARALGLAAKDISGAAARSRMASCT